MAIKLFFELENVVKDDLFFLCLDTRLIQVKKISLVSAGLLSPVPENEVVCFPRSSW